MSRPSSVSTTPGEIIVVRISSCNRRVYKWEIPRAGNILCAYATIFTHRVTTFIKVPLV